MFSRIVDFLKKFHPKAERDPYRLFLHDRLMAATILKLIPKFVLPNHITILRLVLTPFVLWFLITEQYAIGVPLFFAAAFTDAVDGSLARTRRQITAWGTLADPVVDKLLIGLVVLLFVIKYIGLYFGLLIVFFEVVIIAGAFFRKYKGSFVSANVFGKIKMILQVAGVMFLLISLWADFDLFKSVSVGTFTLAILFAILSLLSYGI
ncbi:MAG: CDP-alcohol phosphatidyltransferase family protein [Patescibacteria group bacterium]|jgi:CDP-diacylglycerol--glycerol-3-phosphate 3-phosphatidyltransferase